MFLFTCIDAPFVLIYIMYININICNPGRIYQVKIGLIGFGNMGKTHAFAVSNLKYYYSPLPFEATIAGVCTAHPDTAMRAAETYNLGKVYSIEDEMINDPDIDIIDICTPNIYHYETLKKAIAAGKHIYCEKPLCTTADEANEIAHLASERGISASVVFNTRFLLPVMRAHELIKSGGLGDILSFNASFLHSSAAETSKPAGWKQNREICGGGVLFDLGSHVIDLIAWLCSPFEAVSGMSQIAYPVRCGADGSQWNTNADEAFYMTARLSCGAKGTISVGKIQVGTNDDLKFEIYGSRGAVRFDLMEPNWLWYYNCETDTSVRGFTKIECVGRYPAPAGAFPGAKASVGWLRGHVGSMYNFLLAASRGEKPSPSFAEGAHVQAVMEAAYKSDEAGKTVDVL